MIKFFNRIKKLSPLDGYNKWAETYHIENNPIKRLSDEFINEELPDLKGKSVLDAGCGTGRFCMIAIERGASVVKGIDLSPKMIEQAKKNCPQGKFECLDLATTEIKEEYEVVICGLVLGHIESLETSLANLISALKPKGHLILTDFHPLQTINNAKRTFSYHNRTFEVTHTLHSLDEYYLLLKKSRVEILSRKEPLFNDSPVIFGIHGVAA